MPWCIKNIRGALVQYRNVFAWLVIFSYVLFGGVVLSKMNSWPVVYADPSPQCSDLNIIGSGCIAQDPGSACPSNMHCVGYCYNGTVQKKVCCVGPGDDCGSSCSCTPDPCSVNCPHPNASGYRRNGHTQTDFVRDCSDPCNPNTYTCSCTNYTNSTPSCSISIPSSITYNAHSYLNGAGQIISQKSTPITATLHISDNDERDRHQIVNVSITSNCLEAAKTDGGNLVNTVITPSNRNYQFHIRPLGALDGITPTLSNNNKCNVTLSIRIKDLVGDSGDSSAYRTCSASTTVVYPEPRLLGMQLIDNNPNSIVGQDSKEQNNNSVLQFSLVGSTAQDPNTATILLDNAGTPTQTLKPVDQRFTARVYKMSDKAYFSVITRISDNNGNKNIDLTNLRFDLRDSSNNFRIPLQTLGNFMWDSDTKQFLSIYTYGVNSDGSVNRLTNSEWTQCLNGTYYACVRGQGYIVDDNTLKIKWDIYPKYNVNANIQGKRYYFYVQKIPDAERVNILKGSTPTVLNNTYLHLLDSNLNVKDKNNNTWSAKNYLYLDVTPPQLESITFEKLGTDSLRMKIVVNDSNHYDSGYHPSLPNLPIARTYVFAENPRSGQVPGVRNRFLKAVNGQEIKGQDFGASQNTYGWHLDTSFNNTDNRKSFYLDIKGLLGGDKVQYGFCLYDKAGNANCINSDDSTAFEIGRNWLKTSLGSVYSYGGFAGLPNYHNITNVLEEPTAFKNIVSPFNSTDYASLSTFLVTAKTTASNNIVWGYNNGNYNDKAFYFLNTTFEQEKWEDFIKGVISQHCKELNSCREFANINNATSLENILHDDAQYKVAYVNADITLPDPVDYKNENIIVLLNGAKLTLYNVYKQGGLNDISNSLLIIATQGSSVIIDDNPNNGYDNKTDVVQAGFLILGNSHFKVLQGLSTGNRDAYKDSNGNFDRLIVHGLLYSQTVPILERDLVFSDNDKYPSEWFIYDTNLLNNLLPVLGRHKIQTFKCGVIDHPLCR